MKKLYVITGPRGSGKSTALVSKVPPVQAELDKLCVVDTEDSMSDIVDELESNGLKFGCYIRMFERIRPDIDMLAEIAKGNPPWVDEEQKTQWVGYYEYFVKRLSKELESGKFQYLALDTIEPIEAAMTAAVDKGKKVFGWSGSRAFGKMETEGVRPLYYGLLEAVHRRGVQDILLSSHLKQPWTQGKDAQPIPGKVKPGGRLVVLSFLSTAMFWLVQGGNADGAPAALVLKARMGKMGVVNGQWDIKTCLPQRIPHFTWADVERYRQHPADLANPAPGERISAEETAMISEVLSNEQMKLMVAARTEPAIVRVAESQPVDVGKVITAAPGDVKREAARALAAQGWDAMKIAAELKTPPPIVQAWIEGVE
jgi:hypothetical protein